MLERLNYYIINSETKEIFCPDMLRFFPKMTIIPETKPHLQELLKDHTLFPPAIVDKCKIMKFKR